MSSKINLLFSLVFLLLNSALTREIPKFEDIGKILGEIVPLTNLRKIQKYSRNEENLDQVTLTQPWSGYYWANLYGSLGFRYRDPLMMKMSEVKKQKFLVMEDYIWNESRAKHPVTLIKQNKIDQLSPAEKYDFLIGDYAFTLTHSVWNWGRDAFRVRYWRGICDGWAQASFMFPRPTKAKVLTSVSGRQITFYPEDIKALLSLYMAESKPRVNLIGKRCNSKMFKRGKKCVGLNPAVLHTLLINQLGIKKKPIIFDMDPTPEVWNYPIHTYQMEYIDPVSGQKVDSWRKAVKALFRLDPFHPLQKNRAKEAKFIIGVKLTVKYADDDNPSLDDTDAEEKDVINTKTIVYDLELDQRLNIIGGEYRSHLRPDFAWIPRVKDGIGILNQNKITTAKDLLTKGGFNQAVKELSEKSIPAPSILEYLVQ